jgi:hypothetical protein
MLELAPTTWPSEGLPTAAIAGVLIATNSAIARKLAAGRQHRAMHFHILISFSLCTAQFFETLRVVIGSSDRVISDTASQLLMSVKTMREFNNKARSTCIPFCAEPCRNFARRNTKAMKLFEAPSTACNVESASCIRVGVHSKKMIQAA